MPLLSIGEAGRGPNSTQTAIAKMEPLTTGELKIIMVFTIGIL
jgi:hypothetical protein